MTVTALVSALLATGAVADPWMRRSTGSGLGEAREAGEPRARGKAEPASQLGQPNFDGRRARNPDSEGVGGANRLCFRGSGGPLVQNSDE
jgi:hypothetical protein